MDSVGVGELRRVEAGERIEVTVAGRARATLVPAESRRWRKWADVAAALEGPADLSWGADRTLLDPP